jgi:hypothetical protein
LCGLIALLAGFQACSIPSLEAPQCSAARDALKRFYSFHFAHEMQFSSEALAERQSFITPRYYEELSATGVKPNVDVFTASDEPPRTFKLGKCQSPAPDIAEIDLQVYWRDDRSTVQKELKAEVVRMNNTWLLNKVSN